MKAFLSKLCEREKAWSNIFVNSASQCVSAGADRLNVNRKGDDIETLNIC